MARKKTRKQAPKAKRRKPGETLRPELEPVDYKLMQGLSHPLRVQCLTLINERPWSPRELQTELNEGLSQVSYHIKVLAKFNLIKLVKTEPKRGAVEHFYAPVERTIVPVGMSAKLPRSSRLAMLGKIIQDAERDIRAALKAGAFYSRQDFHASWTPMDLDEQGCQELHDREDEFLEDTLEIEARAAIRIAKDEGETIPISVALFGFVSSRKAGKKSSAHRRRG